MFFNLSFTVRQHKKNKTSADNFFALTNFFS